MSFLRSVGVGFLPCSARSSFVRFVRLPLPPPEPEPDPEVVLEGVVGVVSEEARSSPPICIPSTPKATPSKASAVATASCFSSPAILLHLSDVRVPLEWEGASPPRFGVRIFLNVTSLFCFVTILVTLRKILTPNVRGDAPPHSCGTTSSDGSCRNASQRRWRM